MTGLNIVQADRRIVSNLKDSKLTRSSEESLIDSTDSFHPRKGNRNITGGTYSTS